MQHADCLDDILISVIVPIYNVEEYLPQCIDSLLAQTHPSLEIILVDDGSPDNSGQICDRYAAAHENIRVIHKPNGGLSSARNAGIEVAKGAYIGFVDSDDFVAPAMFRSLLEAAEFFGSQIAACGRYLTDEAGSVTGTAYTLPATCSYAIKDAAKEILTAGNLDVAVWDKLFQIGLFKEIRFPVGRINEDAAIIFQLLIGADNVVHIGSPMYYYRCRSGSITKSGYKPNKIQALEHAEQIQALLAQQYPELSSCCRQYLAYTCCHQLSLMLKDPQTRKQYPDHYKRYMKALRAYAMDLFLSPSVSTVWKLRGAAMLLGVYGPLYTLLK